MSRHSPSTRILALLLSWIVPATSVWAAAPLAPARVLPSTGTGRTLTPVSAATATEPAAAEAEAAPPPLPPAPPSTPSPNVTMGPQAMQGDLKLNPRALLEAGYDFTIPGSHPADTVLFVNAKVVFQAECVSGTGGGPVTVMLAGAPITVPQNDSHWFPSGDQQSPLVYQGSVPAPDLCGGGQITLKNGGTFTADLLATVASLSINVRWHYRADGSSGGWSGTKTWSPGADVTPPQLTITAPANGSSIGTATPHLAVSYQDSPSGEEGAASGVDTQTLSVTLDGVDRSALFTRRSGDASADLPPDLALAEGAHVLQVTLKDRFGSQRQASASFVVDSGPPQIAVLEPAAGSVLATATPTVRISYQDAGGLDLASLSVLVNGVERSALFTKTSSEATATLDAASALPSGSNQIVASIRDTAGTTATATTSFNVDLVPPTLTIGQPAAQSRHGSSDVEVSVQYADDQALDLQTFQATVDGTPITLTQSGQGAAGSTPPLSEGPHVFAVQIRDRAGNPAQASTSFSVDTGIPEIRVVEPQPAALIPTRTPHVRIEYADAQGVDLGTLRILVNGVDRTALFAKGPDAATADLPADTGLQEGSNTIAAEIRDLTGNLGSTSSALTADTVPPTGSLQEPVALVNAATPAIRFAFGDATAGVDPQSVRAFLDGVDVTSRFAVSADGAVGSPEAALAEGTHAVRLSLRDRAGNAAEILGAFAVDTAAPAAHFESPANDSFTNDVTPALRLSFDDGAGSGVDPQSVRIFLRKGEEAEREITSDFEIHANEAVGSVPEGAALTDGTHYLRAVLSDRAGNAAAALSAFEVDTVAPTYQVEAPAAGAYLATKLPAIQVRYRDDRSGVDLDRLVLEIDGIDRTARLAREAAAASGVLLPEDALAEGVHQLELTVVDRAGNVAPVTPHAFTVDTLAPTATVALPPNGAYLGVSPSAIRFGYQDPGDAASRIDTASVRVFVDGADRTADFVVGELQAERSQPLALADGPHTLRVDVKDRAGNAASASSAFVLDTAPPTVASISVDDGSYFRDPSGNLSISGTVQDLDPGVTLYCRVAGNQVAATIVNGQWSCNIPLTEGHNAVEIVASDRNGYSTSNQREVVYDTTAPQLEIQQPIGGTYTNALDVTVVGTVLDASPVTVEVGNGTAAFPCSLGELPGPVLFTCVGVALGDGPELTLRASATDAAGNQGQAVAILRIDRVNPVVEIIAPSAGAYVPGPVVEVRGRVTDDSPVTVDVNGEPAVVADAGGVKTFSAVVPVMNGVPLRATARDAASNVGTAEVGVNVDSQPPVIDVTAPPLGFVTNAASLTITGTISDASPVILLSSGPGAEPCTPASFPPGGGGFACPATLPAVDGNVEYALQATDAAGNVTGRPVGVKVDRTPPQLVVVAPAENAALAALPVIVQGLVTDASGVNVSVDGVPAVVTGADWRRTVDGLADGRHTFEISATDAAGNAAAPAQRVVFLELNAPAVQVTFPAEGSLTNAAEVTVSGSVTAWTLASVTVGPVPATFERTGTATDGRGIFSFTALGVPLAEGLNTLVASALLQSGRPGEASVRVTSDRTPPAVDLSVPVNVVRGRTADALASASDERGLASVEIAVNGVVAATCSGGGAVTSACAAAFQPPDGIASGETFPVVATARDQAGNVSSASRGVRLLAEGIVVGQVLSDASGLPLVGATVSVLGAATAPAPLITDERGRYSLPTTELGLLLRAEREGFTSVEREVAIQAAVGNVPVDARLTPLTEPTTLGAGGGELHASASLPVHVATPTAARTLSLDVTLPVDAVSQATAFQLTPVSPQGLPALLPPGWSPLVAFDLRTVGGAPIAGALDARLTLPVGVLAGATVHVVRHQPAAHAWQMVAPGLTVAGDGILTFVVPALGAYAIVVADAGDPPVPVAAADGLLTGVAATVVPGTSTSRSLVTPPTLPPSGGTALGQLAVASPIALPSGSIVQAEVTETFSLASGQTASEEKRRVDIVLHRGNGVGDPPAAGPFHCSSNELCAEFPITPSRTFQATELVSGTVQMDVFASRSAVRGQAGGSEPLDIQAAGARLIVPAGALPQDTAVALETSLLSEFVPSTTGLEPLGEVVVDFTGKTLLLQAQLSLQATGIAPTDTLLVARVERIEGVPRLAVVALAELSGDRIVTKPFSGLPGVVAGGRYVFFRSGPVGFVFGTTSSSAGPVKSVVESDSLPFIAYSRTDGSYVLAAAPGTVNVTAHVPGTSLAGAGTASVGANQTFNLDVALAGTVTTATLAPPDGATGMATNVQLEIQTSSPLKPETATASNVKLFKGAPADGVTVPVRLLLSSSGRVLAVIPTQALEFSTSYTLEASGLADTFGGLVAVPTTTFRTKDDVKPFYDVRKLAFGYPNENGIVSVNAPACWPEPGCFYPGTTILIVNSGNGVVLSLTAGNSGEISSELPASISDRLLVTVTDPFGNQTSFERSEYVHPDGRTGIGAGGGTVRGPGGVELRVPEGALDEAVTLKIEGFDEQTLPYPAEQKPEVPGGFFGSGLKIQADRETHFKKEVDLAFPLPDFTKAPADQRPPNPKDAFYYVYRRLEGPNGSVAFEAVDVAKVEGEGAGAKVVTASYPFTGYGDGWSSWNSSTGAGFEGIAGGGVGSFGNVGTSIAMVFWTHNALLPGQPTLGVITGRVLRPEPVPGQSVPAMVGVSNVRVEREDQQDPSATLSITRPDGRYTFFDPHFTTGLTQVRATAPPGGIYRATAYAVAENDTKTLSDPALGAIAAHSFHNIAFANILLPAASAPPPAPEITIRVMRTVNGQRQDTGGLVIAGTPLVIGFKVRDPRNGEVSRAQLNGQDQTLRIDDLKLSQPQSPFAMDKLFQDEWTPQLPANYSVTATAFPAFGPAVTSTFSFRVIAEGGSNTTAAAGRPAVLAVRPANGASGLPTDVFVDVTFSEPVTNVTAQSVRLLDGTSPVDVKVSAVAVSANGELFPIDDLQDSGAAVTSLTLQPRNALNFGASYTLELTDALLDLDQPTASALLPFRSSFSTFAPVKLGGSAEAVSEKPRGAGLVVFGDRGYLLETQYAGGIGGPYQSGLIRTYDLQDPIEPRELPLGSPESWRAYVNFPPRDMAGEERTLPGAEPSDPGRLERTLAVVTGSRSYFFTQGELVFWTEIRSTPANLLLYDVSEDGAPAWVGAASLSLNLVDGIPSRVVVKDGMAYVASYGKGLQVVDLSMARSGFPATGAQFFTVSRALSNEGLNTEAVVNTITVMDPQVSGLRLPLIDLKVADRVLNGASRRLIFATGPRRAAGLVIADPADPEPLWRGELSGPPGSLDLGYAIALAEAGGKPLALVGGYGTSAVGGSGPVLVVLDLSPLAGPPAAGQRAANPLILSVTRIGHSIGDILVDGHTAIVSADRGASDPRTGESGLATFVDLSAPGSPKLLGALGGVASRLALGQDGILFSTERSLIKGVPNELGGIRTANLEPLCKSFDLRTPVVTIDLLRDPLNQTTCGAGGAVVFAVCQASLMTLKLDGALVPASLDGNPQQPVSMLPVAPGVHVIELPPGILGLNPDDRKPFTLDAADPNDTSQVQSRAGEVVNKVENRSVLPVGHTFVKGVDLFDGHVVRQATDLKIPGRHLGLEVTRTYSSAAVSPDDVAGAGWAWNYASALTPASCGLYNVTTADGSSQTFRSPDNGLTFTPQKGYHTKLERRADGSFDFTDKAGNVHHFKDLLDARRPKGPLRLDFIQEPHGDRTQLSYDVAGRVREVAEVQSGGAKPRAISVSYEKHGGFDRIARIQSSLGNLNYRVDYEYDEFGNLLRATRSSGGLPADLPTPARTERYEYDTASLRDRHQMTAAIDANSALGAGHRTEYAYYTINDPFPGAVAVLDKEERAKEVRELTGSEVLTTRFEYDLREALSLKWKTSVSDARSNPTLYVLNGNGSPLEVQEPLGKTTKMKWASDDIFKEEEQDALGRTTKYEYDSRGNLKRERVFDPQDALLAETRYEYDERFNKLTLKVDPENHPTEYGINPRNGDLLSVKDAVGNVTRYQYDGGALDGPGLLTSVTSPRGYATSHGGHDSYGNPRSLRDALGNETTRVYDARGRLLRESDTLGHDARTAYDGLDRPRKVTRVAGFSSDDEVTETEYYSGGETKKVTNGKGASTTFSIDGLNRVVATETRVGGETLAASADYDGNGNREQETDRRGVTRKSTFDALNRLKQVEILSGPAPGPIGVVATFDYDTVGNKLFETDVAGLKTDFEYDGLYRVERKLLPESGASGRYFEAYTYDKVGNRTSVTDARGRVTAYEYDGLQRPTRTTRDPGGLNLVTTVDYLDPGGARVNKMVEQDLAHGLRVEYGYDALNRELTRTQVLLGEDGDPIAGGERYITSTGYDDRTHQRTLTDPRNVKTVRQLDGLDRVAEEVVDAGGLNLTSRTAYDAISKVKQATDRNGNDTLFQHDGLGRLRKTTDALLKDSFYEYDGEGLKTAELDRRGVRRTFEYDNLGRPTGSALVPSLSGVAWSQRTDYVDQNPPRRIETDARGNATTVELDRLYRVVRVTDPDNRVALTGWDGLDKVSETDKRGQQTRYEYDAVHRLTKTTDPAPFTGQTVITTYDDAGNRETEKDRRGTLKVTQKDSLGRVRSVTRAGVVLERHAYDGNGNRTLSADAEGKQTKFGYDGANRLEARTDGFGTTDAATTQFTYDGNGNKRKEIDPRATLAAPSLEQTYDALNRVKESFDGLRDRTAYDYDNEGNRTLVQEPLGQATRFEYDELGKLTKVTQPAASGPAPETAYAYDPNRNRISERDANQHAVSLSYDKLNRLEYRIQEGGLTTRHEYDPNGSMTKLVDPKAQTVESTYDELNRLKTKSYAFATGDANRPWRHTTAVSYGYDPNGNLTQVDESVASGPDPPATTLGTTRIYDSLDRLTSETSSLPDGGTKTVAYTYYGNGTRQTVTDPEGRVTRYSYDGQNRLLTATSEFGTPQAAITRYSYFPDDLLKEVISANGATATHGYDAADRLKTLANAKAGTTFSSFTYGYDLNGNRLTQTEVNGGRTESTTYGYDLLNRLKTVGYPDKKVEYGYDLVGNRVKETEKDLQDAVVSDKQAVFDSLNRLQAVTDLAKAETDPGRLTSFTWDANGNQTSKTSNGVTTTHVYDVRDKLVEVQQGAGILGRFQYCYDGKRIKKIGSDGIRQFVYDQSSLLSEYDEAGLPVAKYDYGSDRLISLFRRDEPRRFFSFDGLSSVVNLTSDAGLAVGSFHLDAWGNYRFPSELDASHNRFGFTGHEFDRETGLYNAKARYYDPVLGRFMTQDSFLGDIDEPPSLHRYMYGWDRPTFWIDRTGHKPGDWWDPRSYDWKVFATTAAKQAGRIGGAAVNTVVSAVKETPKVIVDAAVLTLEVTTGVDTGIGLKSQTAKSAGQRMASGEWVGDVTQDTAIGIVKAATNAQVIEEQLNAYADYRTGRATLDVLEDRMAGAAGSGLATAVLAKGAQKWYQAAKGGVVAEGPSQTAPETPATSAPRSVGPNLAKYGDLAYVESVMARAARFSLNRAQAGGRLTGRAAGAQAEATFENYAYQMQQRLMAAESPYRVTLQPAADVATSARALARTQTSFVGRWTAGTKRLDYGFYSKFQGLANKAPMLSGGDFTVTPGGAFGIPSEYAPAFPGARIYGIDPRNIVVGSNPQTVIK